MPSKLVLPIAVSRLLCCLGLAACGVSASLPEDQPVSVGTESWTPGVYDLALIDTARAGRPVLPTSYPSTGGHSGQRVRSLFNAIAEPTYTGADNPVKFPVGSLITKHVVGSEQATLEEATRIYFMRKEPAGYDPQGNDWSWAVANRSQNTWTFSQQGKSTLCTGCHKAESEWDYARTVQVFRTQTPP